MVFVFSFSLTKFVGREGVGKVEHLSSQVHSVNLELNLPEVIMKKPTATEVHDA